MVHRHDQVRLVWNPRRAECNHRHPGPGQSTLTAEWITALGCRAGAAQAVGRVAGESIRIKRRTHVASGCRVVLVRPRYPENVGAVARAMRVTGLSRLVLVSPGPLAQVSSDAARKMAVGARSVLNQARCATDLGEALDGCALSLATTARRGQRGVLTPREAAARVVEACVRGESAAIVFGDERHGLRRREVQMCSSVVRIPMVANEPSLNGA